jgi:ammonia channel protein AmtB
MRGFAAGLLMTTPGAALVAALAATALGTLLARGPATIRVAS